MNRLSGRDLLRKILEMTAATSDPTAWGTVTQIRAQKMQSVHLANRGFQSGKSIQPARQPKEISIPHEEEIREMFMNYESAIGFRSNQGAAVAALEGMRGCFDVWRESDLERAIDSGKVAEASLVRKTLMRMQETGHTRDVVVLWRMLGPRKPSDNGALTPFEPIADMVTEVESAREEMALFLGEERQERVSATFGVVDMKATLEREFWEIAGDVNDINGRIEARMASGRCHHTKRSAEITNAMQARYEFFYEALGKRLEAFRTAESAQLSAELTALASGDHEKTHAEAIRVQLAAYDGPRDDRGNPLKGDQLAAWTSRRSGFISRVRIEALMLYVAAGAAYSKATEAFPALRASVEATKQRRAHDRRRAL